MVALALLTLALLPAAAGAHGGILLASTTAGPYRTQVTAAPLVERGKQPAIDVTVYLSTVDSNTPIGDATVRTTVVADGRTLHPSVRQIAGGYEAVVPVENAFTVGKQRIDVQISGPRGTGRVTIDPTDADGGGPPVALLAGTVVVVLLLGFLVVRVRRGRGPGGARGGRENRWEDDVWDDDEIAPRVDAPAGDARRDVDVVGDRGP
ncbi:hypothetical protein AB0L40_23735 [Patulibacter sp. NPDC049589]|uniref:hypothetical protein n=1 Tax=Patulibacter sp. NPDC049589 TaxID=3154731 RepID=UPI00343E00AA